jgi:hydroxymethylglutaryl-CoA reductase (NADPH)
MLFPNALLKQLYTFGSLENTDQGVEFAIKNRLKDATLTRLLDVTINGASVPRENVQLFMGNGETHTATEISDENTLDFPLRRTLHVRAERPPLEIGKHDIELTFRAQPFGTLSFAVEDSISAQDETLPRIPRDEHDNYSPESIAERQAFVEEYSDTSLEHIPHYSFDPHTTEGNIENFTGVAQIPLGVAGPLTVQGEHAQDDFLIPLATSEGTLVASYNRGMKVCNLSGGVEPEWRRGGDGLGRLYAARPRLCLRKCPRGARLCPVGGRSSGRNPRRGRVHLQRGRAVVHRFVPVE